MTQAAPDKLTICVMKRHDLDLAIDWAAAEGWNPGLKDAGCFQAAAEAALLIGPSRMKQTTRPPQSR